MQVLGKSPSVKCAFSVFSFLSSLSFLSFSFMWMRRISLQTVLPTTHLCDGWHCGVLLLGKDSWQWKCAIK